MKKDAIGNRMKENYEDRFRFKLTRRTPVILRLDGNCFHRVTRNCIKPFDDFLSQGMIKTAMHLCEEIQNTKCAYVQSDEISLLLVDFDTLLTEAYFDYNIQKICSISAGKASVFFTRYWNSNGPLSSTSIDCIFDARVFNIPKEEVCNYFIWRQKDWERNSLQMLSRANYSAKQLDRKNKQDMHDMLHEKGLNWVNLEDKWKNGVFISKVKESEKVDGEEEWIWHLWNKCPIFMKDRDAVEKYLYLT